MKRNINKWIHFIPLSDVESDKKQDGETPCICCGKHVKNPIWFVHLLSDGNLVSSDQDFDNSQGFYTIGAACRLNLPNSFYWKIP